MRKLALPLLAVFAVFAVSVPAASAATANSASLGSKLSKVSGALAGLKKAVSIINDTNAGQTAAIHTVDLRVEALEAKVTAVITTATSALTAIQSALSNSTTGLVGLNLARPQFAAFGDQGTLLASSGTAGGKGPTGNALTPQAFAGVYVLDFKNDVSKRFLIAQPLPTAPGTTPTSPAQAVSCATSTSTAALCGASQSAGSDDNPNHVLVKFGNGLSAPSSGFTVAAISG